MIGVWPIRRLGRQVLSVDEEEFRRVKRYCVSDNYNSVQVYELPAGRSSHILAVRFHIPQHDLT